jgi:hypothetical protein
MLLIIAGQEKQAGQGKLGRSTPLGLLDEDSAYACLKKQENTNPLVKNLTGSVNPDVSYLCPTYTSGQKLPSSGRPGKIGQSYTYSGHVSRGFELTRSRKSKQNINSIV